MPFVKFYIEKLRYFEPNSTFKTFLDSLVLGFLWIQMIYMPIKLGFPALKGEKDNNTYWLFDVVPFIIYCFDILINLNAAYYDKGIKITEKMKIA